MNSSIIYLDYAATTPLCHSAREAMIEAMDRYNYNPSSAYYSGVQVQKKMEQYRDAVASGINASSQDIIFTSGATESTNTAFHAATQIHRRKKHFICSAYEHSATLETVKYYKERGYEVDYVKIRSDGLIDEEDLMQTLREDTLMVSLIHVNNEIGVVNPLENLVARIRTKNKDCLIHIDAVQGYLRTNIDVLKTNVDFMSVSSHKIHGPKGSGFLYVNSKHPFVPLLHGGGQEKNRRSGTENIYGIFGFGEAVIEFMQHREEYNHIVQELRRYFLEQVMNEIPDVILNSPLQSESHIVNLSVPGVKGEIMLNALSEIGVFVATSSACSSKKKVSHVLRAMNLSKERTESALRVSFGRDTTKKELDLAVNKMKELAQEIRMFTKYKRG